MKTLIRQIAAVTLISAAGVGSAFATGATSQSVAHALNRSNVDITGITVSVKDGVATLSGTTNDNLQRARTVQVVKNVEGVTSVVNLVTGS